MGNCDCARRSRDGDVENRTSGSAENAPAIALHSTRPEPAAPVRPLPATLHDDTRPIAPLPDDPLVIPPVPDESLSIHPIPEDTIPEDVLDLMAAELAALNAAPPEAHGDVRPEPWEDERDRWSDTTPPLWAWDLPSTSPTDLMAFLPEIDLDRVDLDRVEDATLVEVVAGWQRVVAYASAQAASAAGALAEREAMNPPWPKVAGRVAEPCVAGEELAMRLGWSRPMGRRLVRDGVAYRGALAWTGEALEAGAICPAKARVLVDALVDQPVGLALAVQEEVLGDAPGLTPTKLRDRVATELLRIDPGGARSREQVAFARRRVSQPRRLPDGMAGIWAVVGVTDAALIDQGIDALARAARDAGDPRTLDQLRADILVDLTLGRLSPREVVSGSGAADTTGRSDGGCRADGTHEAGDTCGAGGTHEAGDTCRATSAGTPDISSSSTHEAAGACPPAVDLGALPRRAVINVTVPLSTLLGSSEAPGELAGYGPIHADTARALALGGPWRRIVTDPLSGAVLDVGRTRYRPPAALADHVRARDRTCVTPHCNTSAHACDLDHTIPYDEGGPTAEHNLDPLCRRDHQLKTHAGFHLEQPAPGVFQLRTPTGQVFDVTPGSEDAPRRHPPRPPWGDPPPF